MLLLFPAVILIDLSVGHAQVAMPTAAGVANITLTSANTEYSFALPQGTGSFTVKSRSSASFQMSYTAGASGTNYFTVPSGSSYYETNVSAYGMSLYFQSANAGQIIEIVYWK